MEEQANLIECIGFSASTLTQAQRDTLHAYASSQPAGDLLGIRLYAGFDCANADALPKGMVCFFAPQAKVDSSVIDDNLFQVTAAARVYGAKLSDTHFESRLDAVGEAVEQRPAARFDASVRTQHGTMKSSDRRAWAPELGGPDSFVGVYARYQDDDMRSKHYYVVGRGTVPDYVRDLKATIHEKSPTYRDLVSNPEWVRRVGIGADAARRSVYRGLCNVAAACEVEIPRTDEICSHLASVDHAHPEVAVPDWTQSTYAIRSCAFKGKPAVALHYGVVAAADAARLADEQFHLISNPYDGIYVFRISQHDKLAAASGVPADTGRLMRGPPPSAAQLAEAVPEARLRGVTWEGRGKTASAAVHPDLHPEAFKPVDAAFRDAMKSVGWNPEHHVQRLIPVAIKIWC